VVLSPTNTFTYSTEHLNTSGPRATVHFTVGTAPASPEIIIEAPAAQLRRRMSPDDTPSVQVRITELKTLQGSGWSGKVAINGIDLSHAAPWLSSPHKTIHTTASSGSSDGSGNGYVWKSHLGNLPDGLHVLDVELSDGSGSVFSRDRRYFELLTANTSHPRGGVEFAADGHDCCEALEVDLLNARTNTHTNTHTHTPHPHPHSVLKLLRHIMPTCMLTWAREREGMRELT
jgi:hypothetical protein